MRRKMQAMERVGSWRFASQVENPGASARGCWAAQPGLPTRGARG
jgi:hypothetical protein